MFSHQRARSTGRTLGRGTLALLVVAALFGGHARGSNLHEHLVGLPTFADFEAAKGRFDYTKYRVDNLTLGERDWKRFGIDPSTNSTRRLSALSGWGAGYFDATNAYWNTATIGGTTRPVTPIERYLAMETLRTSILWTMQEFDATYYDSFLEALFGAYMARVPLAERELIAATVPPQLANEHLKVIRRVGLANGTLFAFYYSVPRSYLLDDDSGSFDSAADAVKMGVKDVISGVDISGSINEDDGVADNTVRDRVAQRLLALTTDLDRIRPGRWLLRVHAFEKANTGSFYDGLLKYLTDLTSSPLKGPAAISIGHMATFCRGGANGRSADVVTALDALRAAKGTYVYFEGSPESERSLQNVAPTTLLAKIRALYLAHVPVVLGSDEQGILGAASLFSAGFQAVSGVAAAAGRVYYAGPKIAFVCAPATPWPATAAAAPDAFDLFLDTQTRVREKLLGSTGIL